MTNTIYIHQQEKVFRFTLLPNFLFETPTFQPLSNEAKLLYAFILRRAADFLIDRIPPEVLAELKQQRRYHSRYRRFCFST
ncbi:hypothetical protein DWY69_18610 [Eisenbergiella massiliensis]|uniref:Replication initiator A N-terminal domain-containing protein n=1 Tax=Eisenbergiella massiliensis TaxID=1720294 RepID=A0A3E3HX92_9FIRM|nr:hypothetical protein DXC51_24010 [Eisenbergiella massiliensis]RGE69101.1 hypothetical protein DWY69_18610 [Eisenbergiella massiliensis]